MRPAMSRPSITRCGEFVSRVWSFRLRGSPSAPLATTTADDTQAASRDRRPAASFRAAGNAAPPRPVRPARSTSSIIPASIARWSTAP